MSSDFAGLAGLSISTIGTVALAGEVGKTLRSYSKSNYKPRRSKSRKSRGKRR